MMTPATNQMMSRSHVRHGSDFIRYAAEKAPAGATNHTHGVLNARGRLGSRMRSTNTPTDTMTNASRVPIETRLPASRTVRSADTDATPMPVMIDVRYGVWNLGWILLTNWGRRPSRDMLQNTRDCPSSITRITDERPMIAPNLMSDDIQPIPARSAATAMGSGTFKSL